MIQCINGLRFIFGDSGSSRNKIGIANVALVANMVNCCLSIVKDLQAYITPVGLNVVADRMFQTMGRKFVCAACLIVLEFLIANATNNMLSAYSSQFVVCNPIAGNVGMWSPTVFIDPITKAPPILSKQFLHLGKPSPDKSRKIGMYGKPLKIFHK